MSIVIKIENQPVGKFWVVVGTLVVIVLVIFGYLYFAS